MDLDLIKFAYKHKLYCCIKDYSSYSNVSYVDEYYLVHLKDEYKDLKEEELNVFSFCLIKNSFSQGDDYVWTKIVIHPNKLSWNDHFIDDRRVPLNLQSEYEELIKNEKVYIFGENIYKLKRDL